MRKECGSCPAVYMGCSCFFRPHQPWPRLGLSDGQEPVSQAGPEAGPQQWAGAKVTQTGAEAHTDRPDLLTAEPSVSALSSAVGEHSRLKTCLGLRSQRCITRISVGIWPGQCELLGQVQFLRLLRC